MIFIRNTMAAAAILLAIGMSLCACLRASHADTGESAGKYEVNIKDFSFQPAVLRIPVGAVVTWTNKDEEPHTVFSAESAFRSRALDTDETFSFTLEKAGTYKYFCSIHPKMVGTIYVGTEPRTGGQE